MENKENIVHQVNIFDRKKIEVVGAVEVLSSTEREVVVKLEDSFMCIYGEKMTILRLVPEDRLLSVAGVINGVSYVTKHTKKSILGKVFK